MVNINPRKLALALGVTAALIIPTSACSSPSHSHRVNTPSASRPDCDLDDLREGDSDCNDPTAYQAAVRKYGSKKVAKAQKYYSQHKGKNKAPSIPNRAPAPTAGNTKNPSLPKANSTKNPGLPKAASTKNATLPKATRR